MSRPVVEFGPPRPGDAEELAANLRDQDVAELRATGVEDMLSAVRESVRVSTHCWTARANGELGCIFGVAPIGSLLDPRGACWMLGTPLVKVHARILAKESRGYIAKMLEAYPHLLNKVHAKNTVSTHWLRKMGFVLQPPVAMPPYGEPFHLFEMKRYV